MYECAHCGEEVDDRGYPIAGKWYMRWVAIYVHANGGYKYCNPQDPESTKAEPRPCPHPVDYRDQYGTRSEYCIICGEDIEHTA